MVGCRDGRALKNEYRTKNKKSALATNLHVNDTNNAYSTCIRTCINVYRVKVEERVYPTAVYWTDMDESIGF